MPLRTRLAAGLVLLLAGVGLTLLLRPAPRPLPVPPNLGALDPQVRNHLRELAMDAAKAPREGARRAELGLAFAVNGLWTQARQSLTDAVFYGASDPLTRVYAAVAQQELGDDATAIRELREVVQQHPTLAPAWHRLGALLLATSDTTGALAAFREVTRLAPDEWRGWSGVGDALLRSGQPAAAVEPLERARSIDPTARTVHHLLGQAYAAVGRAAEAELERRAGAGQTLTPMPDDWSPRALDHMKLLPDQFERADMLLALGRAREAITYLGETLRFHGTNATVICAVARAMTAAEHPEAAWQLLAPVVAREGTNLTVLIHAANTTAALGQTNEALRFADQAVAVSPNSTEALAARANALLAAGRDAEAEAALARAVQASPRNAELLLQLGLLRQQNLGQSDGALAAYRQALDADPLNATARQRLVELCLALDRREEARQGIEDLRRLIPDSGLARELSARLAAKP